MIDDATSRVFARFARQDTAEENLRVLWAYLERPRSHFRGARYQIARTSNGDIKRALGEVAMGPSRP